MYEKQIEQIRAYTDLVPDVAIVLGSGLGNLADSVDVLATVPYDLIDDMPVSTAPSHKGQLVFARIGDKNVVMMQGRVHLYEGYTAQQVVMPIRLMRALGAKYLILTNASGGIDRSFKAGDFMIIEDHISCFVPSPLIGENDDSLGVRFPDMSNAYDKSLQSVISSVAASNGIDIKSGVYVQLTGPQFESPAEIRMLDKLGANAVGMSTVIESIAANHCGFKVCGISLITNMACGILDQPLTSEEVCETAQRVAPDFEKLIKEIVKEL